MIANYHTHTPRCNHAEGAEEAYIRCALDAGMEILGFSDHAPYPFPEGHHSGFRMDIAELAEYTAAVRTLRKQYTGQIEIPLGVEAEYYPRFFEEMVAILRDHGVEYMILGQHFLFNEVEGIGSIGPTADATLLRQYVDQTIDALHTGLFTYFAHPDLMHFVGDAAIYRQEIRRLCQGAKACGIPLEMNLLGIREGRHYPSRRFWEIAAEEGNQVILGVDAHQPKTLQHQASEQAARKLAAELGLPLLEKVTLQPI